MPQVWMHRGKTVDGNSKLPYRQMGEGGPIKARKPIKVIFRKLGREKALGQAFTDDRVIEVDLARHVTERDLLDTVCHEVVHIANPRLAEATVIRIAEELAETLYSIGYRRTANVRAAKGARKKLVREVCESILSGKEVCESKEAESDQQKKTKQ